MPHARHAALLLVAAALCAAAFGGTARSAPTGACGAPQLSGAVGSSTGAMGTIMLAVVLRNDAATSCSLGGWPALGLARPPHRYATTTHHGGLAVLQVPARTFLVHPGGHATLFVAYTDVPHGSAPCPRVTRLVVHLHSGDAGIPVRIDAKPCSGLLRESPLLAGSRHAP